MSSAAQRLPCPGWGDLQLALVVAASLFACGIGCSSTAKAPTNPDRVGNGGTTFDPSVDPAERADIERAAFVESAINRYAPAVHTCWSMAAADDYRLDGVVTLTLVLGDGLTAKEVKVETDEPGDDILTKCLVNLWSQVTWPAVFSDSDAIGLPPFNFVSPERQHVVSAAHAISYPMGKKGVDAESSRATILLDHKNSGNGAAAMSVLTLAPGFSVPMHKHNSTEVLLLLSGEGRLVDSRGKRSALALREWSVAYIPKDAPHSFEVTSAGPAVLLQLYAPGGAEQRFKGIDVGGTVAVSKPSRRDPRVVVRHASQAQKLTLASGSMSLYFDAEDAPNTDASVAGMTLTAAAEIAPHRHDNASEYLFVIAGSGVLTAAGNEREVERFDAIQIPAGVEHSFVAGSEGVKVIQFYTPAGPEQRFKTK